MREDNYLDKASSNLTIYDGFVKAETMLSYYDNIGCSISGGADSDIVMDIITKLDKDKKVKYVWFDTGLEYQATKDHLVYLENKYNVPIQREKAIKSIPLSCKEYGQPFLSKFVSDMIYRLQSHNFQFQNKAYKELIEEYPNTKCACAWWCNLHENRENRYSSFNIAKYKGLKEFLISNPPSFKISPKCCEYSKKKVAETYAKKNKLDLFIVGIRKAEGGIRSVRYKSCFLNKGVHSYNMYFPIFWYKTQDKIDYEQLFDINHSLCYNSYGLKRTGCAGCPFGSNFENELEIIQIHEPKLYKAVNNIFKDSYEYTRMYREFQKGAQ